MDLYGKDCCDLAADYDMLSIEGLESLSKCSFKKKIIPVLPDGSYPSVQQLKFYDEQRRIQESKLVERMMTRLNAKQKEPVTKQEGVDEYMNINSAKFQITYKRGETFKEKCLLDEDEAAAKLDKAIKR